MALISLHGSLMKNLDFTSFRTTNQDARSNLLAFKRCILTIHLKYNTCLVKHFDLFLLKFSISIREIFFGNFLSSSLGDVINKRIDSKSLIIRFHFSQDMFDANTAVCNGNDGVCQSKGSRDSLPWPWQKRSLTLLRTMRSKFGFYIFD